MTSEKRTNENYLKGVMDVFLSRITQLSPTKITTDILLDILYRKHLIVYDFKDLENSKKTKLVDFYENIVVPHKVSVHDAGIMIMETEVNAMISDNDRDQYYTNLVTHDISKFSKAESSGFAFHDCSFEKVDPTLDLAWQHHFKNNAYRPEYWGGGPMSKVYLIEMVAHWMGTSRIRRTSLSKWLPDNYNRFQFHPKTMDTLNEILLILGIQKSGDRWSFEMYDKKYGEWTANEYKLPNREPYLHNKQ